jgi:hypothetical protein
VNGNFEKGNINEVILGKLVEKMHLKNLYTYGKTT